ncbi:MAG TPA: hypothetical protein VFD32_15430 [Dehalococcoidia bacterium]|nr:hypothetical protein [Dehalococcoidia bacterium]
MPGRFVESWGYRSLGGALIALLALGLARLLFAAPHAATQTDCGALPPFVVSLPTELPPPLPPEATPSVGDAGLPSPSPSPQAQEGTATPAPSATVAATAVATSVPWRLLFRADDPPERHALAISDGATMPLVVPEPCVADEGLRRGSTPCVKLLPPASVLCVDGIVGRGRISAAPGSPAFSFQAGRVTVRDADGALRLDAQEGFFRYDDPAQGLALFCPEVPLLQSIGPNARQIVALCRNFGVEGWAVSGQATDGAGAAPDSVSFTIDAPDGSQRQLVGSLADGAIVVREVPDGER